MSTLPECMKERDHTNVQFVMKYSPEKVRLNEHIASLHKGDCSVCEKEFSRKSKMTRTQCPRTDLSKRFLPKPMTTTG